MIAARSDRFPLFDSLRAIAALSIFVFHVAFHLELLDGSVLSSYLGQLNIGVAIFFVISGFLIYRPFAKAAFDRAPSPAPRAYGIRRTLRIVPAYWVALPIVAVMLGITAEVFTPPKNIVIYFGFLQVYQRETIIGGIGPAWTLCIEVSFYVAILVWAWLLRRVPARADAGRLRWELAALVALIAFSIAWKIVVPKVMSLDDVGYFAATSSLPGFADHFAFGMIVAVLSVAWAGRERQNAAVRLIDRAPWLPWLAAAAGFALLGLRTGTADQAWGDQPLLRHELKGLVGVALILPAVFGAADRGWVRRLLANRSLLWLGLVSYAIYLWQLAFILKLKEWFFAETGWLPVALVALAATVATAALSWRYVEAPAQRLGRRLTGREPAGAAAGGLGSGSAAPDRPPAAERRA